MRNLLRYGLHSSITLLERGRVIAWKKAATQRLHSAVPRGEMSKVTFARYISEKPTILEVGAHVGSDTEEFAILFPEADIHCFEPDPRNYTTLRLRTSSYPNVTCNPLAVGNKSRLSLFWPSEGRHTASGSLYAPGLHRSLHPQITFNEGARFPVSVITIDEYVQIMELPEIDLLWMDAQGAEMEALHGAEKTLHLTNLIYTEFADEPLYRDSCTLKDLQEFLRGYSFEQIWMMHAPDLPWGNALFKRCC